MGRHLRWIVSIRQHLQPSFTDTCRIFSDYSKGWIYPICTGRIESSAGKLTSLIRNRDKCTERVAYFLGVLQIDIRYDGSSFVLTSRSIRQHLQSPFTDTCGIFPKCFANRHPERRIVICCDESFDSSRFDNIFNPLSHTLAEYLLSLLQIDFRYAFPCHKRWFLRPPVSQHHLVANRHSVRRFFNCLWRFAVVWVYWTTLPS